MMLDLVFFVWMRTGSNKVDINQFQINTRKEIICFLHLIEQQFEKM